LKDTLLTATLHTLVYLSLDRDTRIFTINLEHISRHCGLLGDPTRLRLLALLDREELTVAELAQVTRLAQPRVSTHLARLREAGLVMDRREGVSVYYRMQSGAVDSELMVLWQVLASQLDDALVRADKEHLEKALHQRACGRNWPDAVAGDMERHYSPGRTWEATAKALVHLVNVGRVLDIASGDGVMGELLASSVERIDCIDLSERVVEAGRKRTRSIEQVRFHQGDMHALPFEPDSFDTTLLLHALTYSHDPNLAVSEAARVTRPNGQLLGATLANHGYLSEVQAYGHVNNGFTPQDIARITNEAGFSLRFCQITSIERRTPNFKILTFLAVKK